MHDAPSSAKIKIPQRRRTSHVARTIAAWILFEIILPLKDSFENVAPLGDAEMSKQAMLAQARGDSLTAISTRLKRYLLGTQLEHTSLGLFGLLKPSRVKDATIRKACACRSRSHLGRTDYYCLKRLMDFVGGINLFTQHADATPFAPTLLRPEKETYWR